MISNRVCKNRSLVAAYNKSGITIIVLESTQSLSNKHNSSFFLHLFIYITCRGKKLNFNDLHRRNMSKPIAVCRLPFAAAEKHENGSLQDIRSGKNSNINFRLKKRGIRKVLPWRRPCVYNHACGTMGFLRELT